MSSSDEISSLEYTSEEEEDLLVLTVDISEGVQDEIHIKHREDTSYMAQVFCDKHKLDENARHAIQAQIEDCLCELPPEEVTLELSSEDIPTTVLNQSFDAKRSTANSSFKQAKARKLTAEKVPYRKVSTPKGNRNQTLLSRMKARSFLSLFEILGCGESTISPYTLSKCQVPVKILEVINPVLVEVMELGTYLSFEDFSERMEILLKGLTPNEKNVILNSKKKKPSAEVLKFKPVLKKSKRSFEVSNKRRQVKGTSKQSKHIFYE